MGHPSPEYTAEFKRRAAGFYRERGCTYAELARECVLSTRREQNGHQFLSRLLTPPDHDF